MTEEITFTATVSPAGLYALEVLNNLRNWAEADDNNSDPSGTATFTDTPTAGTIKQLWRLSLLGY